MPGPGCADVIIICAVVSSVIVSRVIIFCSARRFYDTRLHPATHLGTQAASTLHLFTPSAPPRPVARKTPIPVPDADHFPENGRMLLK
jgi:hypothetical protein